MKLYPRDYVVEKNDDGSINYFYWLAPGFSRWGIWCLSKYILLTTNAKRVSNIQSPFESQIVLSLDEMEISIYQEDQESIDVMSITKDTEVQFKKVIGLFNDSKYFKQKNT